MKMGYVYIIANDRPTLYTGVTSNLKKRIWEHKNNVGSVFTKKYKLHKLIYFEGVDSIELAIVREKQIKDMNRKEKLELIRKFNPELKDFYHKI
ncbi:hypothetical protein A3A93_04605 [Candidatus Roizmanbacteria bacterium RIFCSPLOWO2_01_FULL_38_12]|uniref:GIY-YIG domain-containing protein n=1 Tax=Candidatus Roizmanbacteria bacterium RIFCSPLOWO2_01_FULL_38_12 TaxID=1802061 RepID=A0A1F7IYP4_9BACT|nr:MAG: hypothetical protein A3F59_00780 [Candidatus Roizmanbacteria bacterium RIFCSPHIGHO2_12_FULL_38_13]OGK48445.1 MAG: hypothetical protein A3A93_04605 [Candidatus Roizmanbacteria bacterium RIFCSPLOWO2_01_FULL_38_12]